MSNPQLHEDGLGHDWTDRILEIKEPNARSKILLIPMRVRLFFKQIKKVDFGQGTAQIDFTLNVRVLYENAPQQVKGEIIANGIRYRIGEEKETVLNKENSNYVAKPDMLIITYRESKDVDIVGNMILSPFNFFRIDLTIDVSSFQMENVDGCFCIVRYNLQNNSVKSEVFVFAGQRTQTQHVLVSKERSEYLLQKQCQLNSQGQKTMVHFPSIIFRIQFSRNPGSVMITSYFPMFVLSWLLLAIYQQDFDLADRVANISVLILSYIAFIPVLRGQMPDVPYFTLSDFIISTNLIATLSLLLESVLLAKYSEEWDEQQKQKLFNVTIAISIVCLFFGYVAIVVLYIRYLVLANRKEPYQRRGGNAQIGWYIVGINEIAAIPHTRALI